MRTRNRSLTPTLVRAALLALKIQGEHPRLRFVGYFGNLPVFEVDPNRRLLPFLRIVG